MSSLKNETQKMVEIDTGAEVSLLISNLIPDTIFTSKYKITLCGLSSNNAVYTVGSWNIRIFFLSYKPARNVAFNGLIGRDFST